MYYHIPSHRVAPASGDFREGVRRAALAAMHAPHLSESDSQLLRDLRRQEGRYAFRACDRVLDLLATLPDEAEALAWVDDLRSAIMARRVKLGLATVDLSDAVEAEARAEADANPLQLAAVLHPSPDGIARTMAATRRHVDTGLRLLAALGIRRVQMAHGSAR
jgi:hypothetical protein